jgi:hypothetical protein
MNYDPKRPRLTFQARSPRAAALALALLFVFAAALPSISQQPLPAASPKSPHRQTVIPIERSPHFGAILLTVLVNEKQAVLILDTGSNTTILSPEIVGLNPAFLPRSQPPQKGTGFVGEGHWGHATISIGASTWRDRRVLVVDTRDLSRAAQRRIDGILGQDILDEFKYVEINLSEKRLILGSD